MWRSTPARGQVPPTLRARCPAVPTASYHRLSVSTATVSVSMVAGRILAAWRSWRATVDEDGHYSFAVPLECRSPPCAPIGRFATPCDLALRLVGGRPAGIATWSAYPSIAAAPINPKIDVMGPEPDERNDRHRNIAMRRDTTSAREGRPSECYVSTTARHSAIVSLPGTAQVCH